MRFAEKRLCLKLPRYCVVGDYVWRVLGQAGLLSKWNSKPSKKGAGFEQPLAAHQHWHIDVSYINISGTF